MSGGGKMPRISQFYGIMITMYYNDHVPAHFHARYGEHEATLVIDTLDVLTGHLPRRAMGLVREWAVEHQGELVANWDKARRGLPLDAIAPLT